MGCKQKAIFVSQQRNYIILTIYFSIFCFSIYPQSIFLRCVQNFSPQQNIFSVAFLSYHISSALLLLFQTLCPQSRKVRQQKLSDFSGRGTRTWILNLWSIWNIRSIFASWLASFESNNPFISYISFACFPVREKIRETLNVLWLGVQYKLLPPVPIFYRATGGESITLVDTLSHKFVQAEHTACTIFREER